VAPEETAAQLEAVSEELDHVGVAHAEARKEASMEEEAVAGVLAALAKKAVVVAENMALVERVEDSMDKVKARAAAEEMAKVAGKEGSEMETVALVAAEDEGESGEVKGTAE